MFSLIMEKVALLIVYNHRFDRNIPILENLLSGKWSHIYHIIPFYDGKKENVISVYENSYFYEGYLAQAFHTLRNENYDHYVVMADDMVLNPRLNEHNILSELKLDKNDSFFPVFMNLEKGKHDNIAYAASFRLKQKGAEIVKILPPIETAKKIFKEKGFNPNPKISTNTALRNLIGCHIIDVRSFVRYIGRIAKNIFTGIEFDYPFAGGISDFFVIDKYSVERFTQYCGAFAATNLFIEVALPTSLVLASKNLKTEDTAKTLKSMYLWGEEIEKFAKRYNYSYNQLVNNYPDDTLFIHPVKLSKFKVE